MDNDIKVGDRAVVKEHVAIIGSCGDILSHTLCIVVSTDVGIGGTEYVKVKDKYECSGWTFGIM